MTKKIYLLLSTIIICSSFTSCSNDNECAKNDRLNISFVADIENHSLRTRSTKSGFSENDNIGVYMVDYSNDSPMPIGTISEFMNTEHIYNGNFWSSKNGDELCLTNDQTKADLYAYYPFDYEMSRTPNKIDLSAYPFSVERDQSLSLEESDFLWARYLELSSSNTIAKLTFKHILSKVIINLTYGNLGNEAEPFVIQNLTRNALINMENGNISETGVNSNSEIIPFTHNDANTGFDKTLSAIIIPQSVSADTPIFTITVNNELYAFILENPVSFESGYSYTFNLVIGEANTRSSDTSNTGNKISFVSKTSF